MTWCKLRCNVRELQLVGTLNGGQSFRWKYYEDKDEWIGVFAKTVWKLRQDTQNLLFQVIGTLYNETAVGTKKSKTKNDNKYSSEAEDVFQSLLSNYFQFHVNLTKHYREWAKKDKLFQEACQQFYGIRLLNQEPVENLFSFICSQNNSIARITSMIEKLCTEYGEEICEHNGITYYSFPEVEKLANNKVESKLRNLGFGYRAKFIQQSACQIVEWGGREWFESLENLEYKTARKELMKLHGIGPKVADCICLMSLKHLESVPVDTHVYQIAANNHLPQLRGRNSVTNRMYDEISEHFRNLYGPLAGWAHTVLFCADLKKFQQNNVEDNGKKSGRKRKCS